MPIMDEVALAGGGSFKVVGKGTLGDYMKAVKANFSKGSGAVDDVVKGKVSMAGKTHPKSGIKFDTDGFPIFESKHTMKLDEIDFLKSRGTHFDRVSKNFYEKILKNKEFAKQFSAEEIEIFKTGGVPKRFTWHHHQESGIMQLVDRKLHRQTGHIGGFSIWGPRN